MNKRIYGFSILSAALYILASAPIDFEFIGFFCLTPLLFAIKESKTSRQALRAGLGSGLAATIGLYYWLIHTMTTYGGLSYPLSILLFLILVAYLSLYWVCFAVLVKSLANAGLSMIITAPLIWVALEYIRTYLFSGFPWALLGYTQYNSPHFIQIADLTGVYGISFMLVLTSALIFKGMRAYFVKKSIPFKEGALVLLIIAIACSYGLLRSVKYAKSESPFTVAIIQGNIAQEIKWDRRFLQETLQIYASLSSKALSKEKGLDLILWPETATPFYFQQPGSLRNEVLTISKKLETPLVFGSPAFEKIEGGYSYLNSAFLLSPDVDGESVDILGRYATILLVPLGEYFPLKKLLFFVSKITEGIGDFSPGEGVMSLKLPASDKSSASFSLGPLICYEVIFPNLVRQFVKDGSNVLVNLTNDGWYGRTSAPYQHLSAAVFRSVENKVYLLRAANTGISAIINPLGKVESSLGIFERGFITGKIALNNDKTFYSLYGDVFAKAATFLSFLLIIYVYIKSRKGGMLK